MDQEKHREEEPCQTSSVGKQGNADFPGAGANVSQEWLQAVLRNVHDSIITIDRHGVIQSFNSAAEKTFGYAAAEVIGQNVKLLMPAPYHAEHDGYIQRYRETGQSRIIGVPRELVARRKDGSLMPMELSVTEVDHQGIFTGILRDLSERNALQRHVLEIAAEEQRRIGQELHDGTAQELTGLSLIARTLHGLLAAAPKTEVEGQAVRQLDEAEFSRLITIAARLVHNLKEANDHVRRLSHGIMPVQIDAEGLRSALEELAASTSLSPGVTCRFEGPVPVKVTNNTTATHLYRIAQEAVNNALRHSQGDDICISLTEQADQIVLEVSDDGLGFHAVVSRVDAAWKEHGLGLYTMHYRAGLIGGMLHVERRPAGGTLVRCTVSKEQAAVRSSS